MADWRGMIMVAVKALRVGERVDCVTEAAKSKYGVKNNFGGW